MRQDSVIAYFLDSLSSTNTEPEPSPITPKVDRSAIKDCIPAKTKEEDHFLVIKQTINAVKVERGFVFVDEFSS